MEVLIDSGLFVLLHSVFFLPIQTRIKVPLPNKVTQIVPQLYFFFLLLYVVYVTMAVAASLRVCSRRYEKQTAAVNI